MIETLFVVPYAVSCATEKLWQGGGEKKLKQKPCEVTLWVKPTRAKLSQHPEASLAQEG